MFLFINSGELHSLRSLSMEFDEQAVVFSHAPFPGL